jgi:hypothetical protein
MVRTSLGVVLSSLTFSAAKDQLFGIHLPLGVDWGLSLFRSDSDLGSWVCCHQRGTPSPQADFNVREDVLCTVITSQGSKAKRSASAEGVYCDWWESMSGGCQPKVGSRESRRAIGIG